MAGHWRSVLLVLLLIIFLTGCESPATPALTVTASSGPATVAAAVAPSPTPVPPAATPAPPTPSQIRLTATPGLPAEDALYLLSRYTALMSGQEAIHGISDQSGLVGDDPPLLRDRIWQTATALYLTRLRSAGKALQQRADKVPPDMVEVDGLLLSVGRDMVAVADDYAKGVDTLDVTYITQASERMDSMGSALRAVLAKIAAISQRYGVTS
jgi:hypothetical protein